MSGNEMCTGPEQEEGETSVEEPRRPRRAEKVLMRPHRSMGAWQKSAARAKSPRRPHPHPRPSQTRQLRRRQLPLRPRSANSSSHPPSHSVQPQLRSSACCPQRSSSDRLYRIGLGLLARCSRSVGRDLGLEPCSCSCLCLRGVVQRTSSMQRCCSSTSWCWKRKRKRGRCSAIDR